MDRSQASPAKLDADIVTIILDFVHDTSPKTLSAVALTSNGYRTLARYSQHRTIVLSILRAEATDARLQHIEKQDLLPAIRSLTIKDAHAGRDANNTFLGRVLPRMTGFRDFTWPPVVIPEEVMEVLTACPNIRLHAGTSIPAFHIPQNMKIGALTQLVGNKNLSSLAVRATYTNAAECLAVTQPLKRILLTCNNLRSLELDIGLPSSGCEVYSEPEQYCGFGFTDGERPPALEELSLIRYPFGSHPSLQTETMYQSIQNGYPCNGTEQDYWATRFDWSQLKRLKLVNSDFAVELMPRLTALREVSFDIVEYAASLAQFLRGLPSALEDVSLPCIGILDVECIGLHASTLRRLQMHQNERSPHRWHEKAVKSEQLSRLQNYCPLLEDLSIDLARRNTWPYDALLVLVGDFPRLRRLAIYFQLGSPDAPTEPKITFEAAADMFRYLRDSCVCQPSSLERVEFHSGSPAPIGLGLPAEVAYWPATMAMTFVCELTQRDDERAEGRFYISCTECPELCTRDDLMQDAIQEAQTKANTSLRRSRCLRVALEGPVPFGESEGWECQEFADVFD